MAKVSCPHTIPNAEEARVEPEEMDEDSRSLLACYTLVFRIREMCQNLLLKAQKSGRPTASDLCEDDRHLLAKVFIFYCIASSCLAINRHVFILLLVAS